ncbi:hypothetical protein [Pseudomonas baltica]|uniref:HEPN domain-containing protein n=1 Tax=Pseudomonas baltica TaxID=2762576 RepID=A0A7X1KV79_9PSED|nr:hypothetical protein [Pseudomonas baltica]MBC2680626.1 hypothetical protein [Pseudomonas baltica]
MSVSAEDFLSQSGTLCESADEIAFRSSISRGYYAAYHKAEIAAQDLQLPVIKRVDGGVHEQLIRRFEGVGPGLRKIARRLRDRKRLRAMADYQLSEEVSREEAQLNLLEVTRLMSDLDRIRCSSTTTAKS